MLKIGPHQLSSPFAQAALSGYSDWPMRVIARRHAASYTICEVMLDQFLVEVNSKRPKNKHFLHISQEEHPVGGQLMGAEPEQFSAGASKLVEAGFDVIDVNFGCPVKKVLGRCRGGFHLGQPPIALEIIRRTRDVVPPEIPVTLKMRRGIDDSEESRDHFYEILDGAYDAGIEAITVHGRSVVQRYNGPSDWGFLKEVKGHAGARTILGSGDLFTPEACIRMLQETGVDGVTIARGAIGNPWIFEQCRALLAGETKPLPPTIHQQRDVIAEHYRLAEELYGDRSGSVMRKFGIKYSALHPQGNKVREAFVAVHQPADCKVAFERWYADDGPGRYPDVTMHQVQESM